MAEYQNKPIFRSPPYLVPSISISLISNIQGQDPIKTSQSQIQTEYHGTINFKIGAQKSLPGGISGIFLFLRVEGKVICF